MTAKKKAAATTKAAIVPINVEITIDKGIPIPVIASARGKYPLEGMQPGDSFLVLCADAAADKLKVSIMGSSRRVTKKTGATFVAMVREEEKGVRCWRSDAGPGSEPVPTPEPPVHTPAETFVNGDEPPAAVNTAPALKVFDD